MLIGTHVAVGGGLVKVGLAEAIEVGAEIIQLFGGNPRSWAPRAADPAADEAFRAACADLKLPVVVHAPHLMNLCSPSDQVRRRSVAGLETTMDRAVAIGARSVVLHAGSVVDGARRTEVLAGLHDVVAPIIDRDDVQLLIEPTAGGGQAAAATIDSTIEYMLAVKDERVGLCFDTCHLHAAGEDLSDPRLLDRVTVALGPDRIALVHVNDSRDAVGSHRDRHESLGNGAIGLPALETFLASSALAGVPMLVETPTHARDVALLKDFRQRRSAR
ncbi:deoxyribonuclease IV [Kribbella sp. NBC_01505]|uniref:deoxyribonuclease IV n=1 Tax=Kribbella sp. NBC_01505 TaxID=2903580 RepID=UPI00386CBD75